jgi:hypothetical protein
MPVLIHSFVVKKGSKKRFYHIRVNANTSILNRKLGHTMSKPSSGVPGPYKDIVETDPKHPPCVNSPFPCFVPGCP